MFAKRPRLALSVVLPILCATTACGPSYDTDWDYQERQDAEFEQYDLQREAEIESYKQDIYEESLVESCVEANYDQFYSEDDLLDYCYGNSGDYDYYEPDYYEPDYYEPDYYEPDYDYGY